MRASVVVLSWNAGRLLGAAVDSVRESDHGDVELVVVDNASTDPGSLAVLDRLEAEGVRLLRLPVNAGFAAGMNAGYALTTGDLVVLLNCDAVLHPAALGAAASVLAARPDVGVVAAHVTKLDPGGPWRFWRDPAGVTGFDGGALPLGRDGHFVVVAERAERTSFKPNGACPFLRRACVEDLRAAYGVAPFDPVFDTYGEDMDLAWKCWARGWTTLYRPDVEAGHVRSYASPLERRDKRGRLRTNLVAERYVNAVRHMPPGLAARYLARSVAADVAMAAGQLRAGDRAVVPDVARGWARAAHLLPGLLRYRRRHREWRGLSAGIWL